MTGLVTFVQRLNETL